MGTRPCVRLPISHRPNKGRKITKRDGSSDDIEIDFRQGRATTEFGAELDDGGGLSLEIDQKLKGPVPSKCISTCR
jgi:hypothetical protein